MSSRTALDAPAREAGGYDYARKEGLDMAGAMRLADLTREEVRELAPNATIVLPTASTEQHGPHLPLSTDAVLGEAVVLKAAEIAAAEVPVVVAPVITLGNSGHHLFSCALSLRSATYLAVLNDVADSLIASGFRRIFVLNSHGGNDECVKLMARELVLRHQAAIAAGAYWDIAREAIQKAGGEQLGRIPGHSGVFETSMMMAVAPGLVRLDRMPSKDPQPPGLWAREIASGMLVQKSGEWERTGGYTDAPVHASPVLGGTLLDVISRAVAAAMVAFHRAAYS